MVRNQSDLLRPLGFKHVAATILTCSLGNRVNVMVFHEGHWQKARVNRIQNLPDSNDLVPYLIREQNSHRSLLLKKTRDYLSEATSLVKINLVNRRGLPGKYEGKVFRLTNICIEESQQFFDMRELFLAGRRANKKIKPKVIAKIEFYLQTLEIPGVKNDPRPFVNLEYYQERITKELQEENEECSNNAVEISEDE